MLNVKVVESLAFGPFSVHRRRRLLLEGNKEVRLGSRAFDLLIALLDHGGIGRRQLESRACGRAASSETSLRAQVAALRRALDVGGTRYITNVPGRGYCFVAPVTTLQTEPAAEAGAWPRQCAATCRCACAPTVGRARAVDALRALILQRRFVSLSPGQAGWATTLAPADHAVILPARRIGLLNSRRSSIQPCRHGRFHPRNTGPSRNPTSGIESRARRQEDAE